MLELVKKLLYVTLVLSMCACLFSCEKSSENESLDEIVLRLQNFSIPDSNICITEVYLREYPGDDIFWTGNYLGSDVKPGEEREIGINTPEDIKWDLLIESPDFRYTIDDPGYCQDGTIITFKFISVFDYDGRLKRESFSIEIDDPDK